MRYARVAAWLVVQLAVVPVPRRAAAQAGPAVTVERHAQASSPDLVYLTGGGVLRGAVVDVVPGVEVRVRLADQEVVGVAQREIHYWIRPGSLPAEGPAAPPARSANLKPDEPATLVHLDGWLARLQLDSTGRGQWTDVCSSPCDMTVPTNASYRVVGDGVKSSGRFALHPGPDDRAMLTVHGASRPEFTAGILSIAVGTPVSFVVALTAGLSETISGPSGTSTTIMDAAFVGSAAFAVAGLVLVLTNWTTKVTQDPAAPASVVPPLGSGWPRSSAWLSPTEQAVSPPMIGLPVLAGRF
jgi:hypothetical protein